jgi:hypothetical protein
MKRVWKSAAKKLRGIQKLRSEEISRNGNAGVWLGYPPSPSVYWNVGFSGNEAAWSMEINELGAKS